jgi:hypothetical protein
VLAAYTVTVVHVARARLLGPEDALVFSAEAVWGMLAFATVPALASAGALYAAWQSRTPPGDGTVGKAGGREGGEG